jgi:putative ABC transport system permease protein
VWYLLTLRKRHAELIDEMAFHREMKARELEHHGSAPDDTPFDVGRALGNMTLAQDEAREVWLPSWLQNISQDIRFAARILRKDVRFTATAVVALALGMAVNTTIFSILNTAILRDLPFEDPDQLVSLGTRDSRGRNGGVSVQDFNDWRSVSTTLAGMAAYSGAVVNLSDDAQAPERIRGAAFVSADTFRLLRVQPVVGRDFMAEDDRTGATPVVVLGYGLWQRRFSGDRSVLGRTIRLNGVPSQIIGIMPEHFGFPFSGDLWQPLALAPAVRDAERSRRVLQVFGRLKDGRTVDQVRTELETIAAGIATLHPETNKGVATRVEGMSDWRASNFLTPLVTFMAFVLVVLLIACSNVANLILARSTARSREIAIRALLGATRWRIVRQLLIECCMVALLAGAVGLALSVYGVRYLGEAFAGREIGAPVSSAVMPYWVDLSMNELVWLFAGAMCLLTTLLSGLAPALHVARANTNDLLKESGRGVGAARRVRRWTGAFMIAQIALTIVLLTAAGSILRTFVRLYRTDHVIDTSGVVTARVSLSSQKYSAPEGRRQFLERLDQRLSSSSIFTGATVTTTPPFETGANRRVLLGGRPEQPYDDLPAVAFVQSDARYFAVLGLRMIQGRAFRNVDTKLERDTAVIDQRFAQMFFQGRDPVGQQIRLSEHEGKMASDWLTIVGVAQMIPRDLGSRDAPLPLVYAPLSSGTTPSALSLIVRGRSEIAGVVSQLREEVRALDPDLPVYYVQTLEEAFAMSRYATGLLGGWFGALAVIGVMLAAVGLFAITGHAVTQRTQEIGVRIALGARGSEVVWLFLRRTAAHLVIGTTIGLAGAIAVGGLLRNWLARSNPYDPMTLLGVIVLIVLVASIATLLPARRATRIDPVVAFRYE